MVLTYKALTKKLWKLCSLFALPQMLLLRNTGLLSPCCYSISGMSLNFRKFLLYFCLCNLQQAVLKPFIIFSSCSALYISTDGFKPVKAFCDLRKQHSSLVDETLKRVLYCNSQEFLALFRDSKQIFTIRMDLITLMYLPAVPVLECINIPSLGVFESFPPLPPLPVCSAIPESIFLNRLTSGWIFNMTVGLDINWSKQGRGSWSGHNWLDAKISTSFKVVWKEEKLVQGSLAESSSPMSSSRHSIFPNSCVPAVCVNLLSTELHHKEDRQSCSRVLVSSYLGNIQVGSFSCSVSQLPDTAESLNF